MHWKMSIQGHSLNDLADMLSCQQNRHKNLLQEDLPVATFLETCISLLSSDKGGDKKCIVDCIGKYIIERECESLFKSIDVALWIGFTLNLEDWARVKTFKNRDDREYDQNDFIETQERLQRFLFVIDSLFLKLLSLSEMGLESLSTSSMDIVQPQDAPSCLSMARNSYSEYLKKYLNGVIVHVSAVFFTTEEETSWTNSISVAHTSSIMLTLLNITGSKSIRDILCGDTECSKCPMFPKGIYQLLLSHLQPYLTKELWKRNPAAKEAFVKSLLYVRMPELGHYIEQIFPTVLLMIDDYMVANKIIGLRCLDHLIKNTSSAELSWYGRADVLYDALFQQLYSKECEVIEMALPCLLSVLKIVETSPLNADHPREYSRFNKVFVQMLTNMEMENLLVLRRAYSAFLPVFIEAIGITIVRHSKRLLYTIESYFEQYDGPTELARLHSIQSLSMFIKVAWPRIPNHCEQILKMLLKLVYDVSIDQTQTTESVKDELVDQATKCLVILRRACNEEVVACLDIMKEDKFNLIWENCIKEVLEAD